MVRQLVAAGRPVRALVRPMSRYQHLLGSGVELAFGDLRDAASLRAALAGADIVLASANIIAPRRDDTYDTVERDGYQSLIDEAARAGVQRLVFTSVPISPVDDRVPQFRAKRRTETALMESGVPYTILRCAPYMEVWLALPGSSIPLRGEENPTLDRPYPFLRRFRGITGRSIEDRGRMTVIGNPTARNAFVSLHDVATVMLAAATSDRARDQVFEVGGPEVLTWNDVAALYSQVLGRPVHVTALPPALFRGLQLVMRPLAPAASNIMGVNWLSTTIQTPWDSSELASLLGVPRPRTVQEFLTEKAALPDHP